MNLRYHWYFEGKNAMRWLSDNYSLSYMEIVNTSVYTDIRRAFDAMVIELKWSYDSRRYG